MISRRLVLAAAATSAWPAASPWAQPRPTIRIARIQGINFLPTYLMPQVSPHFFWFDFNEIRVGSDQPPCISAEASASTDFKEW